jgi:hypothetical protein
VTAKFVLATRKYGTYLLVRRLEDRNDQNAANLSFSASILSTPIGGSKVTKTRLSAYPHKLTLELSKSLRNQANNIYTMKYILFLLAAMLSLSAVCGAKIGARISGVVTAEEPCSDEVEEVLWEECVEGVAIDMGVDLSRRLELRGNRELQQSSMCTACCQKCGGGCGCYPRGTYCFTYCTSRRLTITDEQAHTARFLISTGQIQKAANECLDRKIEEGYTCLGEPEDLTIKIYLSE